MKSALIAQLGVLFVAVTVCSANPITLFNTGTNSSNTALIGGNGVTDPHYTIVESGLSPVTFFTSPYVPDDGISRWISESANGTTSASPRTYRLLFDLTGLDPTTAHLTGDWATDNCGNLYLNGTLSAIIPFCNTASSFTALSSFSLTSGFISGVNSLDFVLTNTGGAGALRVDNLMGTANPLGGGINTPEPSTWMLAGSAMAGLAWRRSRQA